VSQTKIDEIDAKIIKDLLIDGRKEFTEIAREAQVSKDVIWQHYSKMKKDGTIVGSTIQLDYAALGCNTSVNFMITVPVDQQQQTIQQLRKIPGIYDAYPWGSHSRIWAVSDIMKTEQVEQVKQLILRLRSVIKLEVEAWTGLRNSPQNLSVLTNDKIPSHTETETPIENGIERNPRTIDEVDRQLIEKLAVNSRAPFREIGEELNISTNTAIRRYNNLKRNHIIRALIQINPPKLGYSEESRIRLTIDSHENLDEIAKKISNVPDVRSVIKTIGYYDLTIAMQIQSFQHSSALENEIAIIQGIREMEPATITQNPILPFPREHISTF
jgi:Lrp/AsnC family transcriptional regulator, regulator for asnA, asnC and gidA